MAFVQNVVVPPSLVSAYDSVINAATPFWTEPVVAKRNQSVMHPGGGYSRPHLLESAYRAGEFIAERQGINIKTAEGRLFVWERAKDVIAGNFDPNYWAAMWFPYERTAVCHPICTPDPGANGPAYVDPNRTPSSCLVKYYADIYPTPPNETGGAQPACGWHGEIQNGVWVDTWVAQRLYAVQGLYIHKKNDGRPLFIKAGLTWKASASHEGNRLWFSANVFTLFGQPVFDQSTSRGPMKATVSREHANRLRIPGPSQPWSHTMTRTVIVDAKHKPRGSSPFGYLRFEVKVCPTPSFGRYNFGNDWAQVWLNVDLQVFEARD